MVSLCRVLYIYPESYFQYFSNLVLVEKVNIRQFNYLCFGVAAYKVIEESICDIYVYILVVNVFSLSDMYIILILNICYSRS